jgi:hypothetical protein
MTVSLVAESQLSIDLDGDGKKDNVKLIDSNFIHYTLSTQHGRLFSSEYLGDHSCTNDNITKTSSGFKYTIQCMRGGSSYQFRYEKKSQRMRLIGMETEQFGNATNDQSGSSSVNLLTNNYLGEWHHFDETKDKLVKLKTIKSKVNFKKSYLDNFTAIIDPYLEKDDKLYQEALKKYK